MLWWPGLPHQPNRDPEKVRSIQRSLDWKRVAEIAAYLLQEEIYDAPSVMDEVFSVIYEPRSLEPGREWPPKVKRSVAFEPSSFPFFSNVLIHVNGASLLPSGKDPGAAELVIDPSDERFSLAVIDGQHRVNGAYLALMVRRQENANATWEIPAHVFLDLDPVGGAPVRQAQIFIDVNLNQKKVDKSLVDDLFPTARAGREGLDRKDRAIDLGRKLMLETGPLVGMIQIPGIRYGVKEVVTLATLNTAIERIIEPMERFGITSLEAQARFLGMVLGAFLEATGRARENREERLDSQSVVYQGRVLVSVLDLIPAILHRLQQSGVRPLSHDAAEDLTSWFRAMIDRAGLLRDRKFISRDDFKKMGFLGSGGIGRFRDRLWAAALAKRKVGDWEEEDLSELADQHRARVNQATNEQ